MLARTAIGVGAALATHVVRTHPCSRWADTDFTWARAGLATLAVGVGAAKIIGDAAATAVAMTVRTNTCFTRYWADLAAIGWTVGVRAALALRRADIPAAALCLRRAGAPAVPAAQVSGAVLVPAAPPARSITVMQAIAAAAGTLTADPVAGAVRVETA